MMILPTQKNPGGRPPALRESDLPDILKAISNGLNVVEIAAHYNCTRAAVHNLMERHGMKIETKITRRVVTK